nr:vacuolar cation/proton exchanger 2 [Quercus suber]
MKLKLLSYKRLSLPSLLCLVGELKGLWVRLHVLQPDQLPSPVLVGWILGQPMDLNFQLFETAMLFMTVLVVAFMLQEFAASFFVQVDHSQAGDM